MKLIHLNLLCALWFISCYGHVCMAAEYRFVGTEFPYILEENADGDITGLGAEITKTIFKRIGKTVKIEILPFKRALKMMEKGQVDAFIGPYKLPQRALFMRYTDNAFYQDPIVFYRLKTNPVNWLGDYSRLANLQIAIIRGWSYGTEFEQYKSALSLSMVDTVESGCKQLRYNRVDLLAANPRAARKAFDKLDMAHEVVQLPTEITVNQGYFAFSRNHDLNSVFDDFNQALNQMLVSGEIARLNLDYGLLFQSKKTLTLSNRE